MTLCEPCWWHLTEPLAHLLILTCFPLDCYNWHVFTWTALVLCVWTTDWNETGFKPSTFKSVDNPLNLLNDSCPQVQDFVQRQWDYEQLAKLLLYFNLMGWNSNPTNYIESRLSSSMITFWPDKFKRGDLSDFLPDLTFVFVITWMTHAFMLHAQPVQPWILYNAQEIMCNNLQQCAAELK